MPILMPSPNPEPVPDPDSNPEPVPDPDSNPIAVYNDLRYIGQGASSMAYQIGDQDKVFKVTKNVNSNLKDPERLVIEKIKQLTGTLKQYFPIIYGIGSCKYEGEITKETTQFCITGSVGTDYEYIIMDKVNGKDFFEKFFIIF